MAAGQDPIVMKFLARSLRKRWGPPTIFLVERNLCIGRITGLSMLNFGLVIMVDQNTSCPIPEKSQVGKTLFSSRAWQISKSSRIQKVLTFKSGVVASLFSCY